jgi:hypothetical protein
MSQRFDFNDVKITIRADDAVAARKIITHKLHSLTSIMISDDPIERFDLGASSNGDSPWRSVNGHPAPKNVKPFFARDVVIADDTEFATAIKWHGERGEFVDANMNKFQFTHWMSIPPL